jgi:hypothetical protein
VPIRFLSFFQMPSAIIAGIADYRRQILNRASFSTRV